MSNWNCGAGWSSRCTGVIRDGVCDACGRIASEAESKYMHRKLIKEAAPDLLDAAKKLLEWVENIRSEGQLDLLIDTQPENFGANKARAAIAKAEGRE